MTTSEQMAYVVTTGSYSDYRIERVFSNSEAAEAFAAAAEVAQHEHFTVEEYRLDHAAPEPVVWTTVFMERDGTNDGGRTVQGFSDDCRPMQACLYQRARGVWFFWATPSKERAVKIANERRVQLIASGEWDRMMAETFTSKED